MGHTQAIVERWSRYGAYVNAGIHARMLVKSLDLYIDKIDIWELFLFSLVVLEW